MRMLPGNHTQSTSPNEQTRRWFDRFATRCESNHFAHRLLEMQQSRSEVDAVERKL
jgi:hypothetical protein